MLHVCQNDPQVSYTTKIHGYIFGLSCPILYAVAFLLIREGKNAKTSQIVASYGFLGLSTSVIVMIFEIPKQPQSSIAWLLFIANGIKCFSRLQF